MPSVVAVVIVSHREMRVDVHRRVDGLWVASSATQGLVAVTEAIEIDVDRLYGVVDGL